MWSEPAYPRTTAKGSREAPATYRFAIPAWVCSSSSSAWGHWFSTASLNRWSEPTPGFATPGEDQAPRTSSSDHLVVDEIGRHADEREVAPPLTDDLVARGHGNKVREALEGHGVTVMDQLGDGLCEGHHFSHGAPAARSLAPSGSQVPQQIRQCRDGLRPLARDPVPDAGGDLGQPEPHGEDLELAAHAVD